jgi:hypothetical protein
VERLAELQRDGQTLVDLVGIEGLGGAQRPWGVPRSERRPADVLPSGV